MEQDNEFLHWIMQSNPLDDPDTAYRSSQPHQLHHQYSQPKVPQHTAPQHPQPSNVYTTPHYPNPNPNVQQTMYDEGFYHKQRQANGTGPVNQGTQQPQPPYPTTSNGIVASGPPSQHYYHPPPSHHNHPPSSQHNQSYDQQQHQQYQQHNVKPVNNGRLSDDEEEHYTDAQLKMMTSKERRQLRNKISARNFRNRRKEYIASLEGEVAKYKNENSQLRLEIKWVRTTMNKLQKENDHLRVKLALCHGGIKTEQESTTLSLDQPLPACEQQHLSPPSVSVTSMPNSSLSPPPTIQQEQSHHVLPISNANVSQKSTTTSSSLNLQTQNGNSPPDLHVTDPRLYQQKQQQQHHTSSSLSAKNDHQHTLPSSQNQPISPPTTAITGNHHQHQHTLSPPGTVNQHQQSIFTTPPSQVISGSLDTIHSDSSSSFASHLSPPNYTDLADAWELVIPNEFSSYCPPSSTNMIQQAQPSDDPLFFTNMPYQSQHHPSYMTHGNALVPANVSMIQQQQQSMEYTANQTTLYRPPTSRHGNQNNSYVSSAVVPDFNFGNILSKQQSGGGFDNNLFKNYPLLAPALMSIVIGHTMSMSTDDLLSHTKLLSTPRTNRPPPTKDVRHCILPFGTSKRMIPGLQSSNRSYPLSKKQVHAMWENLLDQMVQTKSKQRREKLTTVVTDLPENVHVKEDIETQVVKEMVQSTMKWTDEYDDDDLYDDYDDEEPWYDMPVTGFKAICPLYWMQRQFCRFVITYVVVKYPHLEDPCKTYLPICEQFRRRAITN